MKNKTRTAQDFVEDLLTDGRNVKHIMIVAKNTFWKYRIEEVEQAILNFSGKIQKNFLLF